MEKPLTTQQLLVSSFLLLEFFGTHEDKPWLYKNFIIASNQYPVIGLPP